MQQNKVTGVILTSSSDFFASLNLTDTHGITWLGNYGTRLCVAPSPPRPNSNYDFHARRPNQCPFQSFPKGVCWRFHSGHFCRGCNFKHSCFKCGAVHPISQCSTNRLNNNTSNATSSMPSGSDSQGRASVVEPRANTGKARLSCILS